jgi:hypothetical protein
VAKVRKLAAVLGRAGGQADGRAGGRAIGRKEEAIEAAAPSASSGQAVPPYRRTAGDSQ